VLDREEKKFSARGGRGSFIVLEGIFSIRNCWREVLLRLAKKIRPEVGFENFWRCSYNDRLL
jgi:hypothetical protein